MLSKFHLKYLAAVSSSFGLITINCLGSSLPAQASLPCKSGTISYHANGSVKTCDIGSNVDISIESFNFPCKQYNFISFDENAHFTSCVISAPVVIRTGNAVETCSKDSIVRVSLKDGSRFVRC